MKYRHYTELNFEVVSDNEEPTEAEIYTALHRKLLAIRSSHYSDSIQGSCNVFATDLNEEVTE